MNRILFVVLYSIWFVKPLKTNVVNPLSDGFINSINALNTTWKASTYASIFYYLFLLFFFCGRFKEGLLCRYLTVLKLILYF